MSMWDQRDENARSETRKKEYFSAPQTQKRKSDTWEQKIPNEANKKHIT